MIWRTEMSELYNKTLNPAERKAMEFIRGDYLVPENREYKEGLESLFARGILNRQVYYILSERGREYLFGD